MATWFERTFARNQQTLTGLGILSTPTTTTAPPAIGQSIADFFTGISRAVGTVTAFVRSPVQATKTDTPTEAPHMNMNHVVIIAVAAAALWVILRRRK